MPQLSRRRKRALQKSIADSVENPADISNEERSVGSRDVAAYRSRHSSPNDGSASHSTSFLPSISTAFKKQSSTSSTTEQVSKRVPFNREQEVESERDSDIDNLATPTSSDTDDSSPDISVPRSRNHYPRLTNATIISRQSRAGLKDKGSTVAPGGLATKAQQFLAEMCEGYERMYGGQMIPPLTATFQSMAAMIDTLVVCGRSGVQTEPVYVHGGGTYGACAADQKLYRRSDVYPVCDTCVSSHRKYEMPNSQRQKDV